MMAKFIFIAWFHFALLTFVFLGCTVFFISFTYLLHLSFLVWLFMSFGFRCIWRFVLLKLNIFCLCSSFSSLVFDFFLLVCATSFSLLCHFFFHYFCCVVFLFFCFIIFGYFLFLYIFLFFWFFPYL